MRPDTNSSEIREGAPLTGPEFARALRLGLESAIVQQEMNRDLIDCFSFSRTYSFKDTDLAQKSRLPLSRVSEAIRALSSRGALVALTPGHYAIHKAPGTKIPATSVALQTYPGGALSGLWAMSYHGLIMESVFAPTVFSPTAPQGRTDIRTEWGPMRFEHMARRFMRDGYFRFSYGGPAGEVTRIATPEKALLDHIQVTQSWRGSDMETIRLQPVEKFDYEKFFHLAKIFDSERVMHAAKRTAAFLKNAESDYLC
jgi:hypothetical protein